MASGELGQLRRWGLGAVLAFGWSGTVLAQSTDAISRADAQFAEAKRRLAEGAVAEACDLFAASYQLAPRGGALLNLALCHEQQGKLFLARGELKMALARARRDGRLDREPIAIEHIVAVEAKMSWLNVLPPPNVTTEAVKFTVDGNPVERAEWSAIPIEPGLHAIACTASGFQTATVKIEVGVAPERRTIPMQPLSPIVVSAPTPEPPSIVAAPPQVSESHPIYTRRWFWGAVATALAGTMLAVVLAGERTVYPSSDVTKPYP